MKLVPAALLAVSALSLLSGVPATAVADPAGAPAPDDPASALCRKNGATVTIEALPNGAKHAICAFQNGSRIDAATYFRNKHRTR